MTKTERRDLKTHGYVFSSDSDSINSDSGKSEFDEEYYASRPPAVPLQGLENRIVKIKAFSSSDQKNQKKIDVNEENAASPSTSSPIQQNEQKIKKRKTNRRKKADAKSNKTVPSIKKVETPISSKGAIPKTVTQPLVMKTNVNRNKEANVRSTKFIPDWFDASNTFQQSRPKSTPQKQSHTISPDNHLVKDFSGNFTNNVGIERSFEVHNYIFFKQTQGLASNTTFDPFTSTNLNSSKTFSYTPVKLMPSVCTSQTKNTSAVNSETPRSLILQKPFIDAPPWSTVRIDLDSVKSNHQTTRRDKDKELCKDTIFTIASPKLVIRNKPHHVIERKQQPSTQYTNPIVCEPVSVFPTNTTFDPLTSTNLNSSKTFSYTPVKLTPRVYTSQTTNTSSVISETPRSLNMQKSFINVSPWNTEPNSSLFPVRTDLDPVKTNHQTAHRDNDTELYKDAIFTIASPKLAIKNKPPHVIERKQQPSTQYTNPIVCEPVSVFPTNTTFNSFTSTNLNSSKTPVKLIPCINTSQTKNTSAVNSETPRSLIMQKPFIDVFPWSTEPSSSILPVRTDLDPVKSNHQIISRDKDKELCKDTIFTIASPKLAIRNKPHHVIERKQQPSTQYTNPVVCEPVSVFPTNTTFDPFKSTNLNSSKTPVKLIPCINTSQTKNTSAVNSETPRSLIMQKPFIDVSPWSTEPSSSILPVRTDLDPVKSNHQTICRDKDTELCKDPIFTIASPKLAIRNKPPHVIERKQQPSTQYTDPVVSEPISESPTEVSQNSDEVQEATTLRAPILENVKSDTSLTNQVLDALRSCFCCKLNNSNYLQFCK